MKPLFTGRAIIRSIICLGLVLSTRFIAVRGASAHEYANCTGVRWPGNAVSMSLGSGIFPAEHNTAIQRAQVSINTSDFDFFQSAPNQVNWFDLNSSDTTIAGAANVNRDCTNKRILGASLYYNWPHFSGFNNYHDIDQTQCVAIHEMAHVVGFAHNSDTSVLRNDHAWRCHYKVLKTIQPHDVTDINNKY